MKLHYKNTKPQQKNIKQQQKPLKERSGAASGQSLGFPSLEEDRIDT
ncbi:hypothetical protein ACP26L_06220 [Paenibacillus sp. S-38]